MKVEGQANVSSNIVDFYQIILQSLKNLNCKQQCSDTFDGNYDINRLVLNADFMKIEEMPTGYVNCKPQEWSAYNVLAPPHLVKTLIDFKYFP